MAVWLTELVDWLRWLVGCWLAVGLFVCLVVWLAGLVGLLLGWQVGRLVGWVDWLAGLLDWLVLFG